MTGGVEQGGLVPPPSGTAGGGGPSGDAAPGKEMVRRAPVLPARRGRVGGGAGAAAADRGRRRGRGRAGGHARADARRHPLAGPQHGALHRHRRVRAGTAVVGGAHERPLRAADARCRSGRGLRAAHRLGAARRAGPRAAAPPPDGLDHRTAGPGPRRRRWLLGGIGFLLGLGAVLAIAHRDTAWLLTPVQKVVDGVAWAVWLLGVVWPAAVVALPVLLLVGLWQVGRRHGSVPRWAAPASAHGSTRR